MLLRFSLLGNREPFLPVTKQWELIIFTAAKVVIFEIKEPENWSSTRVAKIRLLLVITVIKTQ